MKLVAEWLEMGKYQEFFENLVIAGTQVSKMCWMELKRVLARNKVNYVEFTKIQVVKHVSARIEAYDATFLPFLGAIALYNKHSFVNEQDEEEVSEAPVDADDEEVFEDSVHADEEAVDEEPVCADEEEENFGEAVVHHPIKVKMECIPEIPSFEQALSSVDMTQPIEERVKHVLTAMGWGKKNDKEKQQIFEIINAAVRLEDMSFDNIFKRVNLPMTENLRARMSCAKMINDFVKQYYPESMVKLLDFTKELQGIIMLESEIEVSNN